MSRIESSSAGYHPRVVVEDVDAAAPLGHAVVERSHAVRVRDVDGVEERVPAGGGCILPCLDRHVGDADGGAFVREKERGLAADAAGARP